MRTLFSTHEKFGELFFTGWRGQLETVLYGLDTGLL